MTKLPENVSCSIPGVRVTVDDRAALPGDVSLLAAWFNVVRSLQRVARKATRTDSGNCLAVITVHILVTKQARPLHWTKPQFRRLEPRAQGDALEVLLEELSG